MIFKVRSYVDRLSLTSISCIPQAPPRIITVIAISDSIDDMKGPIIEERNVPANRITKIDTIPIATAVIIQILFLAASVVFEVKLSFLPSLFLIMPYQNTKAFPFIRVNCISDKTNTD